MVAFGDMPWHVTTLLGAFLKLTLGDSSTSQSPDMKAAGACHGIPLRNNDYQYITFNDIPRLQTSDESLQQ